MRGSSFKARHSAMARALTAATDGAENPSMAIVGAMSATCTLSSRSSRTEPAGSLSICANAACSKARVSMLADRAADCCAAFSHM
jgi:hypothetical protein